MYELIILSILTDRTAHGYLMAKMVNNIVGPFARVNSGRLYPLLTKMLNEGLIEAIELTEDEPETGRTVNCYKITPAGRDYFHKLLMDTTSNPGDYQKIFWLKAGMFYHITHEERLQLYDHYSNYCQSHVLYLKTKLVELRLNRDTMRHQDSVLDAVEHRIEHWQHELDWVLKLRKQEVTRNSEAINLQPA